MNLEHIASKEDVWHLIKRGILIQHHFDLETGGLERDYAQIFSYGDAIGDIAGNFINSEELHIKRPDWYIPSPESLLVTRTDIEELDEETRLSHREGMARIAARFEKAPHMATALPLNKKEINFTTVSTKGRKEIRKSHTEEIFEYPLIGKDGTIVHDVRIHPKRNRIAYRFSDDPKRFSYEDNESRFYEDEDGSKWKLVEPSILVSGYRIKWADINWLKTNLVRAGFHARNIYFTYSDSNISGKKNPKNFAVDGYTVAINTHLFGDQGEEGLKLGLRQDRETGQDVTSAALSRVMEANTRYETPIRHVKAGIRMPDNSFYDENKAHRSPAYDAKASFALYNYCRTLSPIVVRMIEEQADEKVLRRLLPGMHPDNPYPDIFAMPRNTYPNAPTVDPVAFITIDDQIGNFRKGVMLRLDGALKRYRYKGKALSDMNPHELLLMIKEQERKPDALIRIESLRRWPSSIPLEETLNSKAIEQWGFEDIDENYRFLFEHPELRSNITLAVEMLQWEKSQRPWPSNLLMEEQATRSGFGDLDYINAFIKENKSKGAMNISAKGPLSDPIEKLNRKAQDIYDYHGMIDEALHMLTLQPHPVDYDDSEEAVNAYLSSFKSLFRKLKKKNSPFKDLLQPFADKRGNLINKSAEHIRDFRWHMLERFLIDDEKERNDKRSHYRYGMFDYKYTTHKRFLFANLSRNYRVVDEQGRHIELEYIEKQSPYFVNRMLENNKWRIQFYRLCSEPSITATLLQFGDAQKISTLPDIWQSRFEALKRIRLNGPPNENISNIRWSALPNAEEALKRIEVNASCHSNEGIARLFESVASGQADTFLKTDEGQRILASYRKFLEKTAKNYPLTPEYMAMSQYDPETGLPYDYIEHEVPVHDHVRIKIPGPHIQKPLIDTRYSPYAFVIKKLPEETEKLIRKRKPVILEDEQTGRLYYPGPISLKKAPLEQDTSFVDFFEQAKRAFNDEAGVPFPKEEERQILVVQKLTPVAFSRELDIGMQPVKVPDLYFTALTAPRLSYFNNAEPLTGLILPVNYCPQKLSKNAPIRFREMNAPMTAKLDGIEETETGHIYESTNLEDVQRMTVGTLLEKVSNGDITDQMARRCGFGSAFDMWEKTNNTFLNAESPAPEKEEIYLLLFDEVKKESWAYYNPNERPEAAFIEENSLPPPPTGYKKSCTPG